MRSDQRALEFSPGVHISSLDGLRGLAILLVLLFHFTRTYLPFFRFGWVGVDLFFVLSGFLITGILIDTKGRVGYFKNFMVRRALRIFPLFYFVLFVFTALAIFNKSDYVRDFLGGDFFLANAGWYWSYGVNWLMVREGHWLDATIFNHFWSLAIEEQFYLVWPFIVWLCSAKVLFRVAVAFIVCALLLRFSLLLGNVPAITAYVATTCRVDALALGALLAICVRRSDYALVVLKYSLPTVLAGAGAAVLLILLSRSMDNLHPVFVTIGYTLNAVMFGGLLIMALAKHRWTDAYFNHPVMLFLGKYSYSLYVYHVPVYMLLVTHVSQETLVEKVVVSLAAAMASVILAMLSWRLLERPFLSLKRYFA